MSMTDFKITNEEMLLGIKEGRISAEGAERMLRSTVRAHSNEHARQRMHRAVDQAFGNGDQQDNPEERDEFSTLFPANQPLGPPIRESEQSHFAPQPGKRVEDKQPRRKSYASAAPAGEMSDGELFEALFGFVPPPEYWD